MPCSETVDFGQALPRSLPSTLQRTRCSYCKIMYFINSTDRVRMCGSTGRGSEPLACALLEEMLKGLYSVAIVATRAAFRSPKVVKKQQEVS